MNLSKIKNSFLEFNWSYILITVIFFYHFCTLAISPFPWYDEIWYCGITNSFLENGRFFGTSAPLFNNGAEILTYGPVYFVLTSVVIKIFGWGAFQFRIVSFLFGIGVLFVSYLILNMFQKNKKALVFFLVIIASDYTLGQNIHSGRMDLVAIFFALLSFFFLLSETKKLFPLYAGLAAGLSVLTTPRVAFVFLGLLLIYFFRQNKSFKTKIYEIFIWGATIVMLYFCWSLFAHGGLEATYNYYNSSFDSSTNTGSIFQQFIGFRFGFSRFHYHLYLLLLLLPLYYFFFLKKNIPTIFWISIIVVVIFELVVVDTGMYSIYIIPFFYLAIFSVIFTERTKPFINNTIFVALLAFNLFIFAFKSVSIIADYPLRQSDYVDNLVRELIPQNSKVVANDMYFYAIKKNNSLFQTIEYGATGKQRFDYHKDDWKFDYLIINKSFLEERNALCNYYIDSANLEFVREIDYNFQRKSLTLYFSELFFDGKVTYSYNGVIYKRKKE